MKTFYVTLDEKVITWVRNTVQVKNCNSYREAVKKVVDSINSNEGIYCSNSDIYTVDSEELCDTEEPMSVSENEGFPTVEILEKHNVIWNNVDRYIKKSKS